ncbi:hypothetical protein BJX99DRAFT_21474 [Aspergillus californicus]
MKPALQIMECNTLDLETGTKYAQRNSIAHSMHSPLVETCVVPLGKYARDVVVFVHSSLIILGTTNHVNLDRCCSRSLISI